uniref:Uncharacterized protein n=1 Tax=Aegilops tauschii subsp. strangulata TaxID=200361 RepID=A0A453M780_AEGTS
MRNLPFPLSFVADVDYNIIRCPIQTAIEMDTKDNIRESSHGKKLEWQQESKSKTQRR